MELLGCTFYYALAAALFPRFNCCERAITLIGSVWVWSPLSECNGDISTTISERSLESVLSRFVDSLSCFLIGNHYSSLPEFSARLSPT